MRKDPIVDKIQKKREAYAKKFGYDARKILADIQSKEKKWGLIPISEKSKKVVRLKTKRARLSKEVDAV